MADFYGSITGVSGVVQSHGTISLDYVELIWVFGPAIGEESIWHKTFECLQPLGKVVGLDLCRRVQAQLRRRAVVIAATCNIKKMEPTAKAHQNAAAKALHS